MHWALTKPQVIHCYYAQLHIEFWKRGYQKHILGINYMYHLIKATVMKYVTDIKCMKDTTNSKYKYVQGEQ